MNKTDEVISTLQFLFESVEIVNEDIALVNSGDLYGFYAINHEYQSDLIYARIDIDSGMVICSTFKNDRDDLYRKSDIYFINANKMINIDKAFKVEVSNDYLMIIFKDNVVDTHALYRIDTGELIWTGTCESSRIFGEKQFIPVAISDKKGNIFAIDDSGNVTDIEDALKSKFSKVDVTKGKVKINKYVVTDTEGNKFSLNVYGQRY